MTASARYKKLESTRHSVLYRAREAAKLTIPALMPDDGHNESSRLPTPYQSLGARGVNNLASKMLMALLPANTSFFRLSVPQDVLDELGESRTDAETALQDIEGRIMKRIETSNLRVTLFEALKHLIVVGDGILYLPRTGDSQLFRLDQFVTLRDASGNVVEVVIKEKVHPTTLSDEVRAACKVKLEDDKDVDVFTHIKRDKERMRWYQEINDIKVPDSDGDSRIEESPYLVLRWQAVANEDYGRSLVDEYMGDLISLEELSKAIIQFSAIAAKILFLLHPNAQTDEDDLTDAESGDVIIGSIEDIDVLQLDKYADFQVAKNQIDDLTLRLSHAFLLTSGTVRNAERVTAEEVRMQAQELEDVLGGVYTVQSQELQLPLVRRLMGVMTRAGEIPALPEGLVDPIITTGFDALGRGHDLNRLRAFLSDVISAMGPEALAQFDPQKLLKQLATGHGVDIEDMLKTPQQLQAEQQAAMTQQMAMQAAPGVAQEVTKGMTQQATGG